MSWTGSSISRNVKNDGQGVPLRFRMTGMSIPEPTSRSPEPALPLADIVAVQSRLQWMRAERIWPNGLRYLWTDAFGVVLLVSLWQELHVVRLLRECEWVVAEVDRVLGR